MVNFFQRFCKMVLIEFLWMFHAVQMVLWEKNLKCCIVGRFRMAWITMVCKWAYCPVASSFWNRVDGWFTQLAPWILWSVRLLCKRHCFGLDHNYPFYPSKRCFLLALQEEHRDWRTGFWSTPEHLKWFCGCLEKNWFNSHSGLISTCCITFNLGYPVTKTYPTPSVCWLLLGVFSWTFRTGMSLISLLSPLVWYFTLGMKWKQSDPDP